MLHSMINTVSFNPFLIWMYFLEVFNGTCKTDVKTKKQGGEAAGGRYT